jgi:hypothetical protein
MGSEILVVVLSAPRFVEGRVTQPWRGGARVDDRDTSRSHALALGGRCRCGYPSFSLAKTCFLIFCLLILILCVWSLGWPEMIDPSQLGRGKKKEREREIEATLSVV